MYDYNLSDLGQRFDVIYIDPPLEEYQRRVSGINFPQKPWGFEEVGGEKPLHTHTHAHTICIRKYSSVFGSWVWLVEA